MLNRLLNMFKHQLSLKLMLPKLFNPLLPLNKLFNKPHNTELLKETPLLKQFNSKELLIKLEPQDLEWNMSHSKKPSLNMTQSIKLNIFLMKRNKLNISQLNIRLNTSHMFIPINMLTISHKKETKKELNTTLLKNKLFTLQVKKLLNKSQNKSHNQSTLKFQSNPSNNPPQFNKHTNPPLFNNQSNPQFNNQSPPAELLSNNNPKLSHNNYTNQTSSKPTQSSKKFDIDVKSFIFVF